jgi:hypothetical protein
MWQVVDIVCAIISAYTGAVSLFHARKERKEKQKEVEVSLEQSLISSPPRVQGEYDRDFARLGQVFATGDGKICPSNSLLVSFAHKMFLLFKYCMHRILGVKERLWLTFIVS